TEPALIDMGDFVGGMLKYIRAHPVPRVTIAGGVAKMTKLAQGLLDLHSKRGAVDLAALARFADAAGGSAELRARILAANTGGEAFAWARGGGGARGVAVARGGGEGGGGGGEGRGFIVDVVVFDRDGTLVGRAH